MNRAIVPSSGSGRSFHSLFRRLSPSLCVGLGFRYRQPSILQSKKQCRNLLRTEPVLQHNPSSFPSAFSQIVWSKNARSGHDPQAVESVSRLMTSNIESIKVAHGAPLTLPSPNFNKLGYGFMSNAQWVICDDRISNSD